MEAIFRKYTALYVRVSRKSLFTWFISYLFTSFYLHFFGSIWSVWVPSNFGQGLVRRQALSFIFHGIYDFKDVKAPVTAARNYTSVLQRHNATLSSAIPYRRHPVVSSRIVWAPNTKTIHEPS